MHEGAWSSRLGIPGIPAEAEELMVMRDLALARLTGRPRALPTPLDRRQRRSGASGQAARDAGHRRGLPSSLHAHRFRSCELRPALQGEPTAAHGHRHRGDQSRTGRWHDRRHRDRPRARTPRRSRRPRSTKRRCGMLGLETALALALTELDLPLHRVLALMSWQPAAIAEIDDHHGGPIAEGSPANLVRDRSGSHMGRRSVPACQPQPQHPLRGPNAHGPGTPHAAVGRTRRHRRRGPTMTLQRPANWR